MESLESDKRHLLGKYPQCGWTQLIAVCVSSGSNEELGIAMENNESTVMTDFGMGLEDKIPRSRASTEHSTWLVMDETLDTPSPYFVFSSFKD